MKAVLDEIAKIVKKLSETNHLVSRAAIDSEASGNPLKYPGLMSFTKKERLRQITLKMDQKYPRIFNQNPVWQVRLSSNSIEMQT